MDAIRHVACAVRPYLAELVGPSAERIDRELGELLNGGAGDEAILVVFEAHDELTAFYEAVMDDAPVYRPPKVRAVQLREGTSFSPVPGDPVPVPPDRFQCPAGDYIWFRPSVGVALPRCPTHDIPVVPR